MYDFHSRSLLCGEDSCEHSVSCSLALCFWFSSEVEAWNAFQILQSKSKSPANLCWSHVWSFSALSLAFSWGSALPSGLRPCKARVFVLGSDRFDLQGSEHNCRRAFWRRHTKYNIHKVKCQMQTQTRYIITMWLCNYILIIFRFNSIYTILCRPYCPYYVLKRQQPVWSLSLTNSQSES